MDRPEPGLIKWSPNSAYDSFLHVNLQHRVVQIYKPTGHAQRGRFDFDKLSKHDDFPPLTTYDWSPTNPGLVAIGTSSGVVNLLRVDDNSNAYIELNLRVSRLCHAVAFNKGNLLAVGLERVRNDHSLHIWDVTRVSVPEPSVPGFPLDNSSILEPSNGQEPSVAVSSVKFFEDNPHTLAVGIKNQAIHIYDLRDHNPVAIRYPTKCNNNLAIDYADPNYFASSALDQPAVFVWDRRVTSRSSSSNSYLEAVNNDGLPWGAAMKLDHAIEVQPEQFADKHSLIRSLRYCRDRRGLLAVLSRTGQLKVLDTQKEFSTSGRENETSPELLEVRRSYELDLGYSHHDKKNDRIVSFDWVTLDSPVLTPRAIVLRANGAFEILEKPSYTSEHVYKMVPWQSPYRGLEEGASYHGLMQFEASHYPEMMGPLLVDQALSDVPLFGENGADINTIIKQTLQAQPPEFDVIKDFEASDVPLPESFRRAKTTADKLQALRRFSKEGLDLKVKDMNIRNERQRTSLDEPTYQMVTLPTDKTTPQSHRQLHEKHLALVLETKGFPKEAQIILDHVALFRAKDRYLFNASMNRKIVYDDPWLRDMWDWISGAEEDASGGGMVALGMDLSYLGARSIWANDLGHHRSSRLAEPSSQPDRVTWEHCLRSINKIMNKRDDKKKKDRGDEDEEDELEWNGVKTDWPAHRQACMRICRWGRTAEVTRMDFEQTPVSERNASWHTMTTALALFRGKTKKAIRILKGASAEHPELLFVSLALQLIGRGEQLSRDHLDFDDAVASNTDPYLRAISSLIATNDWEIIANQESLPLRERSFVAFRYLDDERLTKWLDKQVAKSMHTGSIEGIVLTGITDKLVDIFAKYIEKFNDVQTATLVLSICSPRYIDDYRCLAWRKAYIAYLQRHKAFYERAKFEVESSRKSQANGVPTVKPPVRQIALRCVYCDAEYELSKTATRALTTLSTASDNRKQRNPLMVSNINAGISCPNCGRHLPRCVVCLEVVGMPRTSNNGNSNSDGPDTAAVTADRQQQAAARFPTFCLKCEHVLHLDHARQWFARHVECPVPECRCKCNSRLNSELNYH